MRYKYVWLHNMVCRCYKYVMQWYRLILCLLVMHTCGPGASMFKLRNYQYWTNLPEVDRHHHANQWWCWKPWSLHLGYLPYQLSTDINRTNSLGMRPLRRVGAQEGPQDLPGGFRISGAGVRHSNCSRNFWIHGTGILWQHLHAQIRFVPWFIFGSKMK